MSNRNRAIDFGKFIASLLIIGIHTGLFADVNEQLGWLTVNIVCRFAVPFFAVITGFFLSGKLEKAQNNAIIWRQLRKLGVLYAVWSVLYLIYSIPVWISTGWFSFYAFIDYAIATVLSGSHYHLWYLLSLIYAIPLFGLCYRYLRRSWYLPLAIMLYAVKALSYGYSQWMPSAIQLIFSFLERFSGIRDAVFLLLPMLLLGAVIQQKEKQAIWRSVVGLTISVFLLILEAEFLKSCGQQSVSFIVSTMPAAYFLFCTVSGVKCCGDARISGFLASISLLIYCLHPMIIELLPERLSSILAFLITTTVSILLSSMIEAGKRGINLQKTNK